MAAAAPRKSPKRKAFIAQRSTTDSGRLKEECDEAGISLTSLNKEFSLILRRPAQECFGPEVEGRTSVAALNPTRVAEVEEMRG
jgi:hypothetical protein